MSTSSNNLNDFPFFKGGGEMGALMRTKDWANTILSTPDQWPVQLKQLIATILDCPSPMLICWSSSYLQFYNDAFRPILGTNKHPEALGIGARKTYPEIWGTIEPLFKEVMQGNPVFFRDFRLEMERDGNTEEVFFDFSYSPVKDENGLIQGILVVCQETTPKVKSLKRLSESEELFRTIAEQSDILIALGDTDGNPIYFNKAWHNLTGSPTEELINNGWANVIHPDDLNRFSQKAAKFFKLQKSFKDEFRILGKEGKYHLILSQNTPRFNKDGVFEGYLGSCTLITERAQHERDLERAFEQLRLSKEAAQLGTFDLDLEKGTLEWDERCRILFGISHKEKVTYEKDFVTGLHSDDRERVLNVIDKSFVKSISNGDYDVEYRTVGFEDGVIRWVKAKGKVFFDAADKPIRFIGSVIDITDQKNATHNLEESEARFRALVEEAPIATCLFVGKDQVIEVANEKMLGFWGKGRSVFGKPLAEAVPELVGQPFLEILDTIFTTGVAYTATGMRADLMVDGVLGTYYFDFTYKPLFNTKGEVYAIMDMAVDVTEQVLAQQRIEETQRELLSSFEESPVSIAIISEDNLTFRNVNSAYAALVDRKPEDLINKPLLVALPELTGQGFDNLLRSVIETGVPFIANSVKVDLVKNGKPESIYVDFTYQPRYEGTDQIVGVLVVAVEVTEQVNARRKIEESETKLRSIISSAPAGIGLYVGSDFIIENPNQTFIDLMGKGSDIVGKPLKEVMPELITENQPFLQILDKVFKTGKEYHSSGSLAKIIKNGILTEGYYNITYTPVFNADGEIYAILEIAVEVTEQIKAQQALEEAEAELRVAIELAGLVTWKLDIKNQTYKYSPRFMHWLGFNEDTQDLIAAYNPLPGDYRESVPALINKITSPGGSGIYDNEHPVVNHKTGQVRLIHAQGQVFYDATGNPAILSGIAQDITLQREMQLALEAEVKQRTRELDTAIEKLQVTIEELAESNTKLMQSNAELAQFAYIASHDLQEPLRKISTFSQLLERSLGPNPSDDSKNFLAKIRNSSVRMTALIRDVLMYSQLVKENDTYEKVNLNEIFENILSDYELLIEQKKATIDRKKLPVIEAIPLQMSQLFANLLSNALKFVQKDVRPIISINTQKLSETEAELLGLSANYSYYNIQFTDNGIGIPPEYIEKVFHIFQRLHRKSEYEGTGIGLAICKKIAQNHHGDISIENNVKGGSTFNVILPENQTLPTKEIQ
ncbi:PAS domain S-box protein [Emticicia sp. BO119]|uniref:PAS domain S-box protein n=1 Tax=Emticicia sp. BO119 TaxID=2757768 RepID=UPI0015F06A48|nr:PAS domain S-box protein [Emticicia sp. BO119]MBA4849208.1 PAS domain S-box protein [Emticicia sp. BO119]